MSERKNWRCGNCCYLNDADARVCARCEPYAAPAPPAAPSVEPTRGRDEPRTGWSHATPAPPEGGAAHPPNADAALCARLRARIIALRAEVERLQRAEERISGLHAEAVRNWTQAEARARELEQDAARWNRLCDLWMVSTELMLKQEESGAWGIYQIEPVEDAVFTPLIGNDPESAIDAARKEGEL